MSKKIKEKTLQSKSKKLQRNFSRSFHREILSYTIKETTHQYNLMVFSLHFNSRFLPAAGYCFENTGVSIRFDLESMKPEWLWEHNFLSFITIFLQSFFVPFFLFVWFLNKKKVFFFGGIWNNWRKSTGFSENFFDYHYLTLFEHFYFWLERFSTLFYIFFFFLFLLFNFHSLLLFRSYLRDFHFQRLFLRKFHRFPLFYHWFFHYFLDLLFYFHD